MDPWIVAKVRCFNINNSDRPQSRQGVCTKHPPTQTRTRSSCQAWSSPSHTPPSSSHQADAFSSSKGCLNKANQLSSAPGPIGASHVQLAYFTPEHFTFRCRQTQHAFVSRTRRSFLRMTASQSKKNLTAREVRAQKKCSSYSQKCLPFHGRKDNNMVIPPYPIGILDYVKSTSPQTVVHPSIVHACKQG